MQIECHLTDGKINLIEKQAYVPHDYAKPVVIKLSILIEVKRLTIPRNLYIWQ